MIDATPERERIFNAVKNAFFNNRDSDWMSKRTMFVQYDGSVDKIAKILLQYADYIGTCYDCLFMETEKGIARITCLNGEQNAIRLEYIKITDYEWIDCGTNKSDWNREVRQFTKLS